MLEILLVFPDIHILLAFFLNYIYSSPISLCYEEYKYTIIVIIISLIVD